MARKKKVPGPIVSLGAYLRLSYRCIRCKEAFDSPKGPEIFCDACKSALLHKGADK